MVDLRDGHGRHQGASLPGCARHTDHKRTTAKATNAIELVMGRGNVGVLEKIAAIPTPADTRESPPYDRSKDLRRTATRASRATVMPTARASYGAAPRYPTRQSQGEAQDDHV